MQGGGYPAIKLIEIESLKRSDDALTTLSVIGFMTLVHCPEF
jgi:hypothetical protein